MPKAGVESHGLLQPEEFDIDELDYLEPQNHVSDSSRNRKSRRNRCLRPRCLCFSIALIIALLLAGVALNRGGHVRIPKFGSTPSGPSVPSYPKVPSEPDEAQPPTFPDSPEDSILSSKPDASPIEISRVETTFTAAITTPTTALAEDHVDDESTSTDSAATPGATESSNGSSSNKSETSPTPTGSLHGDNHTAFEEWKKPTEFKIIGLIFFGRPATVSILDCYLKKNLAVNGGWLDEVHFIVNTDKKPDLKWLAELVKGTEQYKSVDLPKEIEPGRDGYNAGWATCEKGSLYIKIDDDIVFFDDHAVSNIVYSLMKHPEALNVEANLINSPETGWLHYRFGAIHAYLPELSRKKDRLNDFESYGPTAWRASALPDWEGEEMSFHVAGVFNGKDDDGKKLPPDAPGAPPFKGHRWLPLPDGDKNIWRTPMAVSEYNANGNDWQSWSLGAQAHYSFLQNLENDDLHLYHYGNGLDPKHEGLWNMEYERMNINFMAIWGKDVLDNLPFRSFDDELALSVEVPHELKRPLLVNTHAIAAHFGFRSQAEMYDTDLLDRYRAYANENICTKDNQLKPIP
ncbi:uncharacterized protein KY384_006178 [Bacidia gigantensis]|uniref:uncharacterized protein n=1 Tax=Bacidia gigantensis TaxID=2732470 RepID=UPI001D03A3B7|nr:uncharacterized protein KY384_006178 [Bacidia gigantensis]KAG8529541.1 hypothetical protein KY384_006178 [Bacidia gigantensis]